MNFQGITKGRITTQTTKNAAILLGTILLDVNAGRTATNSQVLL